MPRVQLPNNPDNYMIPSGISIWFAPQQEDGSLCTPFDLGCVSEIALTLADEYLEHECARNGLRSEDQSVITKVMGDVKFTIEEMVGDNLILAFRPNVVPDAGAVYEVLERKRIRLIGEVARVIDAFATELSATDYLDLTDVVVRSSDGLVTYTAGDDYVFTQASGTGTGRVPATIARSGSGSAIVDGTEVVVDYRYSREATKYSIQTGAILEGAMWVQALNRIGPLFAYFFPRVSIRVEGDTTINPAEYFKQAFSCKILTAGDGTRGEFYLFDRFNKLSAGACAA